MNRLVSLIFVVGAIGIFFAYVNPTYTGPIRILNAEISNLDRTLLAAEEFRKEQARLEAQRAQIPPESLRRVETLLPDNVDNVQLILDVDGIATLHGVRITDIGIEERQESDFSSGDQFDGQGVPLQADRPYQSINLSFSAIATYTQFKDFLRDLERSLRLLDVVSIEFSEAETGVYTYDMTVRVYWLK